MIASLEAGRIGGRAHQRPGASRWMTGAVSRILVEIFMPRWGTERYSLLSMLEIFLMKEGASKGKAGDGELFF